MIELSAPTELMQILSTFTVKHNHLLKSLRQSLPHSSRRMLTITSENYTDDKGVCLTRRNPEHRASRRIPSITTVFLQTPSNQTHQLSRPPITGSHLCEKRRNVINPALYTISYSACALLLPWLPQYRNAAYFLFAVFLGRRGCPLQTGFFQHAKM